MNNGLCQAIDAFGIHQFRQNDRKFVAAKTGYGIRFAHAGNNALRHIYQQRIPHIVPQRIVHLLELIEVDVKQSQREAASASILQEFLPCAPIDV